MLFDLIPTVSKLRVILASGSPRRSEILRQLGLRFTVRKSSFAEDLEKSKFSPDEYCRKTSEHKVLDVWRHVTPGCDLIIGSDTVVVSGDRILEKPNDEEAAVAMLESLSGKTHRVISSVSIMSPPSGLCDEQKGDAAATGVFVQAHSGEFPGTIRSWTCSTDVSFAELPLDAIKAYVATGEPMDKAGGYGIQGLGGAFVTGIRGCYYNVMGFPMHSFAAHLRTLLLAWPPGARPKHVLESSAEDEDGGDSRAPAGAAGGGGGSS